MANELPGNPYLGIKVSDDNAALVAATLALAYEQRTANILFAANTVATVMTDGSVDPISAELYASLMDEARTRLGDV